MNLSFKADGSGPLPLIWPSLLAGTGVTVLSLLICAVLMPLRLPGIDLLGTGTNWLLIWVVAWSVGRGSWEAIVGGLAAGAIHDGLTDLAPTHAWSLALVGYLVSKLHNKRGGEIDFAAIALTVFGVTILAETVMAGQFVLLGGRDLGQLWIQHQRFALSSGILNSLWSPAVVFPLDRLWSWAASRGQR